MPIIKYIAVHSSPLKLLRYMTKAAKTEKNLVSGLNCSNDPQEAYEDFKFQFECFTCERFYKKSLDEKFPGEKIRHDKNGKRLKETVRIHHYIQSFKPGEVTAEQAHKIGLEWAREVFGNNHSVLVSTHIDKGHIHNHIAAAAFNMDGKRWYGNKETLKKCRSASDSIAKFYGLSVIEHPKYKPDRRYGNHLAEIENRSWKQELCNIIDEIICMPDVQSIDDLIRKLQEKEYEIRRGKYLSVKPQSEKKAIRTYRLGDGYALECLEYRIKNKDKEMPLSEVYKYEGEQRKFAMLIRQIQIEIYRKPEKERLHIATYKEVLHTVDILNFVSANSINNSEDFQKKVNAAEEKVNKLCEERQKILDDISLTKKFIEEIPRYLELDSKPDPMAWDIDELAEYNYIRYAGVKSIDEVENYRDKLSELQKNLSEIDEQIKAAKSEHKDITEKFSCYREYLKTDYDVLRERTKAEMEAEREAEERRREEAELEEYDEKEDWCYGNFDDPFEIS